MTLMDLKKYSEKALDELQYALARREDWKAYDAINSFRKYYNKHVVVVKGRKVPHGTTGVCFWMGTYDNSKYGDPWGFYTTTRVGIRDADENVYWTSVKNIELVKRND